MPIPLRALLRDLPTRSDIEAWVGKLEAAHRKYITAVRKAIKQLTDRVDSGESSVAALERRMQAMENRQTSQATKILTQQLQLENTEDRSRRNNLRLRGLPEAPEAENLSASTLAVFRDIAGEAFPTNMSFDQINRALGPSVLRSG